MYNVITPFVNEKPMLAYLESQKQQGRPIVLAFPILYPREIVTALGACAWEIWSQPLAQPIGSETNRLQAYVCPMVRLSLIHI